MQTITQHHERIAVRMSDQMRCVYCGNVLYSRPYSCCGEVNHCEPVDDEAEPQPCAASTTGDTE